MKIRLALSMVGFLMASGSAFAASACPMSVTKTDIPLQGQQHFTGLCIEDYFQKRDLGRISIGEDAHGNSYLFRDRDQISFDDMILFEVDPAKVSLPLGTEGRLALDRLMFNLFLSSLRGDRGETCQLSFKSGDKVLSVDDLMAVERKEAGQPGTRIKLYNDDVPDTSWQVLCPDENGKMTVSKQGTYFFIFFDTYESQPGSRLKGNLAKFLVSFR